MERVGDFAYAEWRPGGRLFVLPSRQFKTTFLKLFLRRPLDEATTATALLASMLRRGTARHPTRRALAVHLEELYGASFTTDVSKLGEQQLLTLRVEGLHDRFLDRPLDLLGRGLDLCREVLEQPREVNGGFPEEVVAQERCNLKRFLEGVINDKMAYATRRLTEEMFRGEPYGRYEYGSLDELPRPTPGDLRRHLRRLVAASPLDVFVVGDHRPATVARLVRDRLVLSRQGSSAAGPAPVTPRRRRARRVVERREVGQGKIVQGWRVPRPRGERAFYGLMLFNALLGGGPFSKLFRHVREEAGLAYYADSLVDKAKGALFVSTGIDSSRAEEVLALIRRQVRDLRRGRVEREVVRAARASLVHRLQSLVDQPGPRVAQLLDLLESGRPRPLEEVIRRVRRTTVGQAIEATEGMWEDTTFLLGEAPRARR